MKAKAAPAAQRRQQREASVGACNTCRQVPNNCVCTPTPGPGWPGFTPPYPGGGPGGFTSNPGQPPGTIGTDQVPGAPPSNIPPSIPLQMYPPNVDWAAYAGRRMACIPYEDAIRDCLLMSTLSSGAPVAIAAGATGTLTIQPDTGYFDGFYIDVIAVDPTTGAESTSFFMGTPTIVGCPAPCDDTEIQSRFWRGIDGCCCGRPFRTIVAAAPWSPALTISITNDGATTQNYQAILRGFCYPNRICV